jgi:hypothetical protein
LTAPFVELDVSSPSRSSGKETVEDDPPHAHIERKVLRPVDRLRKRHAIDDVVVDRKMRRAGFDVSANAGQVEGAQTRGAEEVSRERVAGKGRPVEQQHSPVALSEEDGGQRAGDPRPDDDDVVDAAGAQWRRRG